MSKTKTGVMFLKLLFYAGLLFTLAIHTSGHNDECPSWLGDHLLHKIIPRHYNISLTVNENTNVIYGVTSVFIEISEPVAKNLTFYGYMLRINIGKTVLINNTHSPLFIPHNVHYCKEKEIVILEFASDIFRGLYRLTINYEADVYENNGLVKSHYTDENGYERSSYVTMFELTGARRLFPCWDDREMGATFNISILHPPRYTVFSNMLNSHTQYSVGSKLMKSFFHVTPEIPTYFVTIALIDLYNVPDENRLVYVRCTPQLKDQVLYAQSIALQATAYLNTYLRKSYKLTINLITLPLYSGPAIGSSIFTVYREKDIVYNSRLHFGGRRISVGIAVAQGVSLQLLDSFESPTHWTDVWLNKALAIFYGHYVLNQADKYRRTMDLFVVQVLQPALRNDIELKMVPITHEFDSIYSRFTYSKASIIIRMLQQTVTNNVFRSSVIEYFKDFAPQTATSRNFTRILQKKLVEIMGEIYSKFDLEKAMVSWITQRRYPVLSVQRQYYNRKAFIFQDKDTDKDGGANLWWQIPITYTTKSELNFNQTMPRGWLYSRNQNVSISDIIDTISIGDVDANDWIIVNIQQTGYYRVNYDIKNWVKIGEYLNSSDYKNIHVLNRAQLIDDAYYFVINKKTEYSVFLNIIRYLSKETDYIPWHSMINILWYISPYLEFQESSVLKQTVQNIFDGLLRNIGYDDNIIEDDIKRALRLLATRWACELGVRICRLRAQHTLLDHLKKPKKHSIGPEWKEWTYCGGLKESDITIWRQFMNLTKSKNDTDNLKYLHCAEDELVISEYLSHITSENPYFDSLAVDTRLKLFASILKKHARKDTIFIKILSDLNSIKISNLDNKMKLIYLTMNVHSEEHFNKITEFINRERILLERMGFKDADIMVTEKKYQLRTLEEVKRVIRFRRDQLKKYKNMYRPLL